MKLFILFLAASVLINAASAQSVGIGTASPNAKAQLDVVSTTKGLLIPRMTSTERLAIASPIPPGLMVYETNSNSFWYYNGTAWVQQAAGGVSPWVVSGTNIFNSNTGSVAIGSSSPDASAVLDVKSTTKGFLMPAMGSIQRVSIANPAEGLLVYDTDANKTYQYQEGVWRQLITNDYWVHSPTRNVVYNSIDSVGIGTSVPSEKFHVTGNARVNGDILSLGSIGAGTLNPAYTLDVNGPGRLSGNVYIDNGFLRIRNTTDAKNWDMLYSSSSNRLMLLEGGMERVLFQNGGNVGIAPNLPTITAGFPSTKLHIETGQDAGLSASSNGYLMLGPASGTNLIIDNNEIIARSGTSAGSLVLQNDGGSVRIGSAAVPTGYKFAINGKMICEEVKVKLASSGWPDYVFGDTYKLRSLAEVEQFIIQNKHLPNIPSAAEVEKEGIEVGDMQKRMMEKIEELTLYIIELEKKVEALAKTK
ncbi:MAG: hypothetical protein H7Y86_13505 [Rhizobacter sp.]|nr:hypothetical protein [Ferruginibacter sp.]